MSIRYASISAAAFAVCATVAFAQAPAPAVSVAGCIQKESSVLKRNPIATSIGMDDEFVITFAKSLPAPGASDAPTPDVQPPPDPVGTSGSPGNFGTVYRLTGDKEKELKSYVGQRVEIGGSFKAKDKVADTMSSIGTSGKTEATPDNTAEIAIETIKPVSGSCAPVIK